ncbi:lipoyl domain-containing protein [bacterium 210820-DFI.6.37]|nr:lipoyl domain-containing protein [bacterium 210820-DFI.6.37]
MEVVMPRLGMTMQDGKIVKWYFADGDKVTEGEPLLDIETEKLNNTVNATATGIFTKVANEGDTIACGEVIARID